MHHRFHPYRDPHTKVDGTCVQPDSPQMIGSGLGIFQFETSLSPAQNVLTVLSRKAGTISRLCGWHASSPFSSTNVAKLHVTAHDHDRHLRMFSRVRALSNHTYRTATHSEEGLLATPGANTTNVECTHRQLRARFQPIDCAGNKCRAASTLVHQRLRRARFTTIARWAQTPSRLHRSTGCGTADATAASSIISAQRFVALTSLWQVPATSSGNRGAECIKPQHDPADASARTRRLRPSLTAASAVIAVSVPQSCI